MYDVGVVLMIRALLLKNCVLLLSKKKTIKMNILIEKSLNYFNKY